MDQSEAMNIVAPDVDRTAERLARNWNGAFTADDAYQEILLAVFAQRLLVRLAEQSFGDRMSVLRRLGNQYAAQEKSALMYFSGQYRYSHSEVLGLLRNGALLDERPEFSAARADIDVGMEALRLKNPRYARLIFRSYALRESITGSDSDALYRGVEALVDLMNIKRLRDEAAFEGQGSREAYSNSRAQFLTGASYSGESEDPEAVFG